MWRRTGNKIISWTIDDEDHWQINSRGYFILFRLILSSLIIQNNIGQEERPPRGQLWMEQCLTLLKYWPI